MNRRDFLKKTGSTIVSSAIGVSFGAIPGCGFKGPISDPELPNVILITADNMGWKDLGCFGNRDIDTPNLDRLSYEGIRFTNAFVVSSSCSPSRASIITGQYPHTNVVVGLTHLKKRYSLRPWYETLPSLLNRLLGARSIERKPYTDLPPFFENIFQTGQFVYWDIDEF